MSKRVLVLVLAAATDNLCGFQPGQSEPQVEVALVQQKYCLGQPDGPVDGQPPDAVTLRMTVRLEYRNSGQRPVIIPAMGHLAAVIVRPISSDNTEPQRIDTQFTVRKPLTELPTDINKENPFNAWFKVIPSKDKFDKYFEHIVVLRVHCPSLHDRRFELLGKKIRIQLEITHKVFSERLTNALAEKWSSYGRLWAGTVVTHPIEVSVPLHPSISDCSHEYHMD